MITIAELRKGIECKSVSETIALAQAIIPLLPLDFIIALSGDLGAGKTTFTKGLALGLNITRTITSPTYNIYSVYSGRRHLIHMDAYRLDARSDIDSMGINDSLQSPYLMAIEWPEKMERWIVEQAYWWFEFKILKNQNHRIQLVRESN